MNKIYKIAITALTTAIISVSALAAPHDGPRGHIQHPSAKPANSYSNSHWQNYKGSPQQHRHPAHQQAQNWQVKHKLPQMYQNSSYKISSYQRHQLSKPNHDQQWYKVNGYYLLTDKKTDTIVKVVRA